MTSRTTVAAVIGSSLALITLGGMGAAQAARTGGHDSVGSYQITDGSVRSIDVKDGGIGFRDLNGYTKDLVTQPGPQGRQGEKGDKGDPGEDGQDGQDGQDGVSGLEIVSDTQTFSGGGWGGVSCPEGKVVISGGYEVQDPGTPDDKQRVVVASRPVSAGDVLQADTPWPVNITESGWWIQMNKPANVNPGDVTIFAVCAAVQ